MGGLRVVGGTLELIGAGALCLAPEPTVASKAGCVVFGLHGSDTLVAGARQAWTGIDTADLTQSGASKLARTLGADAAAADRIGLAVDIGVPLATSAVLGAARLAAVRGGRASPTNGLRLTRDVGIKVGTGVARYRPADSSAEGARRTRLQKLQRNALLHPHRVPGSIAQTRERPTT